MILPTRESFPSFTAWLDELARVLESEDERNQKRNQPIVVPYTVPLILVASDGSRWRVRVSTAGVLSTEAA